MRAWIRRRRWLGSTAPTWSMPRLSRASPTEAVSITASRIRYCDGLRRCFTTCYFNVRLHGNMHSSLKGRLVHKKGDQPELIAFSDEHDLSVHADRFLLLQRLFL